MSVTVTMEPNEVLKAVYRKLGHVGTYTFTFADESDAVYLLVTA